MKRIDDKGTPLNEFFRSYFPNIENMVRAENKKAARAKPILPPEGTDHLTFGNLGKAVEYRIKFNYSVDFNYPEAHYVNGLGLGYGFAMSYPNDKKHPWNWLFREIKDLYHQARPDKGSLSRCDEEMLCRYCYTIATTGQYRYDRDQYSPEEILNKPAQWMIADIAAQNALYRQVAPNWLNVPTLWWRASTGLGRSLSGFMHASAGDRTPDLLIDGCIVEIKSSHRTLSSSNVRQILACLLYLGNFSNNDVNSLAVYRSRYGVSHHWSINDFLIRTMNWPELLPNLQEKFRQALLDTSEQAKERSRTEEEIRKIERQKWLDSPDGKDWLSTSNGWHHFRNLDRCEDWLNNTDARQWLASSAGRKWLAGNSATTFLDHAVGNEWLCSEDARQWLSSVEGRKWLYTSTAGRKWLRSNG